MGVRWHTIVVLICIYLVTSDLSIFSCAYWPFVHLLRRKSFAHFRKGLFVAECNFSICNNMDGLGGYYAK